MKACAEYGHCDVGSAVPTLAFNLNADYIIHAVVPRWKDGNHREYELLSSAYLTALNVADRLECESIIFPLLASGNNGFDKELAFRIAKESFESFSGEHLKKIILIIHEDSVALLIKSWGYEVDSASYAALLNERKVKQKKEKEERIKKVRIWLEANQDMIIELAVMILKIVVKAISEDKKKGGKGYEKRD